MTLLLGVGDIVSRIRDLASSATSSKFSDPSQSLAVTLTLSSSYKIKILIRENTEGPFSALTDNTFVVELAGCRANYRN